MQEGAKAANIEIMSFETFYRNWYDATAYTSARVLRPFGSAFREGENAPDGRPYVPVVFDDNDGHRYSIEDLAGRIRNGTRVVLTGDFGTGKSRAAQQLFMALSDTEPTQKSPIAIDLRTMWGTQSADEMVRRHYSTLQLGDMAERAIEALHNDDLLLLLDGFDELAIQEWGSEPGAIAQSRARTMEPVRDILNRTKSGALVSGRAHYFSSDEEMIDALGLGQNALVVATPPEFSPEETRQFLQAMGFDAEIPVWLPRKPLIAEMYADFVEDGLSGDDASRPKFWESFIEALCRRDAKIRDSYDPETIKLILCKLSRSTRETKYGLGPISPFEVQSAFSAVVGQIAAQEAASMLQRLPGLGRVAAENDDRQFVDDFIVEGLRGLDVCNIVAGYEFDIGSNGWKHGAGELGLEVVASRLGVTFTKLDAIKRLQSEREADEAPLLCDIVGGMLFSDDSEFDFSGAEIDGGYMSVCNLSEKKVIGLHISSCEIGMLNIFNSDVRDTKVTDSTIEILDGVSGEELPDWIEKCAIGSKSSLDTVARIKKTQLTPPQMILVTILRKTFFQPGSGRKEEALMRGLGELGDAKLQSQVLNVLIANRFLNEVKGNSGKLFVPERSKTSRAKQMMSKLQMSVDDVWESVSGF